MLEVDGLEPVACSVGVLGSPPAGKAGGVMEHDLTVVRPVLRGRSMTYIAECSCGWESRELSTAGMAQSARDAHVTEVTREGAEGWASSGEALDAVRTWLAE